jgi:hypothetical protein
MILTDGSGVRWSRFQAEFAMKRKANRRDEKQSGGSLLLVLVAALFVVLLMIRLLAFVAGHGAHHF